MFRDILQSKWFTAVISVVLGFFLISVIKLKPPLAMVGRELGNLNHKIDEAEKNSLELEELSDYLKSNAYLERQARLKLNYKKPDEKVVFVYRKTGETMLLSQTDLSVGQAQKFFESKLMANLKSWWGYLINK
ncbi:MAG: septum formation initiator family protein [Candidatus Yanofskybacteria bacterium]|nr:septum formation initiator family protein [Candidatus Yanofskybacteria bacterium]